MRIHLSRYFIMYIKPIAVLSLLVLKVLLQIFEI